MNYCNFTANEDHFIKLYIIYYNNYNIIIKDKMSEEELNYHAMCVFEYISNKIVFDF